MEVTQTRADKEEPVFRLWLEGEKRQSNTGSAGKTDQTGELTP
jgi:hypothetical protein